MGSGTMERIDAVITWVDGEDPKHRAKRARFLTQKRENQFKDVAGETRYNQVGEIYYCIASIVRFAPWINKIYIVTDEQDPKVEGFIQKHFPESRIPIEIIDHKVIFEGYEECLPTFNSLSITSMLWRIPSLSEKYILFNDDIMLHKPTAVEDYFVDDKVVLYGKRWIPTFLAETTIALQTAFRKMCGKKALLSFKKFMLNAAYVVNQSKILRLRHTPHPFLKSVFKEFYEANPQALANNIKHRFRNEAQYSSAELHHLLATEQGRVVLPLRRNSDVIITPHQYSLDALKRRLRDIRENPDCLYFCVNSLDQSSPEMIAEVTKWMNDALGLAEE